MNKILADDKFSALIDAAVDCIFVISGAGVIEIANHAVQCTLGYEPSELIGHNVSMIMPQPHQNLHDGYLKNYLDTGEAKIIGIGREVEAIRKDGSSIQIHLSVGLFEVHNEIRFVGVLHDISLRKQNEADLAMAETEILQLVNHLAHASRISVLGEMVASIAHEINQPLTAIATYARASTRLLEADESANSDVVSALDKICDQALRAGDIIKGMRTWVKEQDTQRRSCNCNELINDVLDIATMEARENGIEIELSLEPQLNRVICDPVQIQQVILNLIKNAIDSVAGLQGDIATDSMKVLVSTKCLQEERIQVTVTDHGSGIDDEVANKLFNPFFSTKETGMGMGLSICQTIVRAHGGELNYESVENGGISFYFILPTAIEIK